MSNLSMRSRGVAVLIWLTAAAVWAARQPGAPLRPSTFNFFSRQQDVQLGHEASVEILKKHEIVRDEFLQRYLRRIGERLADTPEARQSEFAFTFTVLNDAAVNAFALPGGPMFVNTGLFYAVDNEAQLAGAMAHEMSHVILRHGTTQASKANMLQIPALLAEAAGSPMLSHMAEAGVILGLNKFSRKDEAEADALGAHLMAEAGWNPLQLGRFFQKLEGSQGPRFLEFLSDHPDPGNRVRAIGDEVQTLPSRRYGYESGQFEMMKVELRRIPAPRKSPTTKGL